MGVCVHRRVRVPIGVRVAVLMWHRGRLRSAMRPRHRHADAAKGAMCHALHGLRQVRRVGGGHHRSAREAGQLDATPAQLVGQTTVLIGGHSEYWTRRMYDAAVQARDAGTNFGFLGANEIYWQGRIERDAKGRETALTVYRDSSLDRLAKANPAATTIQWRHAPLSRDPAALVGVGMSVVGVRGAYVVNTTPDWLFAGTKLRKGSVLAMAYGNEVDAQEPPTGHSPANLQVVLHGVAVATGRTKPSSGRALTCIFVV